MTSLALSLRPQAPSLRAGAEVRWELRVTSHASREVTLTFHTAQRGDVALERGGVNCYRWSEGMMFAQALGEQRLAPGETRTFELEGRLDVEPGEYEAIGTLVCRPAPPLARMRVVVEAGEGG